MTIYVVITGAVGNEECSCALGIVFHIAELVELMSKVGTCLPPRELSAMKKKSFWILEQTLFLIFT